MRYRIESERLVISCTPEEQADLEAMRQADESRFDTDDFMYDLLERLTTDDSFSWINADVTGDLTAAPMLAILGDEEQGPHEACNGLYPCGANGSRTFVQPVLYRWAFMNYVITTPQRELLESGEAVFTGGAFVDRPGQMGLAVTERDFSVRNFPL